MDHKASDIPCIFIVDDDAAMRRLMADALEGDGYEIMEYNNGMEAIDAIRIRQPDMLLLDVKLPVTKRFDICSRIRENYGDIDTSVVVVTGLDDSQAIEEAFKFGATAFINKPINWVTFPHTIRYLLKARNAFVDLKNRETHLEHMDKISRIITQLKDRDAVLQESMQALLDIFNAERAVIISTTDNRKAILVTCDAVNNEYAKLANSKPEILSELDENFLSRARRSDYPLISTVDTGAEHPPGAESGPRSRIIRHIHTAQDRSWYLIVQKSSDHGRWSSLDQETFNQSSARIGGVLSQHLLMERLHRNEHLLRQAQHIRHLGNWSWNVTTGELSWSDELFLIYGYEPGSFTPTYEHFYKITFAEDDARISKFEQTRFDSGETYKIEHRILLPTGDTRWVQEHAVGLLDDNGQLIEIIGTVQDITERLKKQEQELHDNKMEAIGQLTSGIAHDFGNLMTIAKGNLDLLLDILPNQYDMNADDIEILNDAYSAIQDGVQLTKQLLSFCRKKSTSPENLSIEKTLVKFDKLIQNTLGTKISLAVDIQDDLPDILVDSALFASSLINIIINARDAMPGGGSITITAKMHNRADTAGNSESDETVNSTPISLSIEDTGVGMADDVLQHAVVPFFTTKDEGTGLGLSMAYGFMKQSGGELQIESRPGTGTRVTMNFPVYSGAVISHTEEIPDTRQAPRSATVLVVEDNEAVRQLVVRCLRGLGLKILESESADRAQRILYENNDIDLLFTDILMPGNMNGRELANWANANYPALKVLVTTAAKKEALQLMHARDHPFQFLLKPYSMQELVNKVLKML